MTTSVDIKQLLPAWEQFSNQTDIAPIRDQAHYDRMIQLLEALLEEAPGNEKHPAMSLADIVGDLIEDYETLHLRLPDATGIDALRFLMQQHGLKQNDLTEIGSQGVVSEILSGKRELNIRQIRALSERFGVSPATPWKQLNLNQTASTEPGAVHPCEQTSFWMRWNKPYTPGNRNARVPWCIIATEGRSTSPSATRSDSPRPGSNLRWAAVVTAMTTPWPRPSTACTRRN